MNGIYLDNQATTSCDQRIVDAMMPYFGEEFGNPHSTSHAFGYNAASAVERAREQVANVIGVEPTGIVFTSGATESNNLAIKGAARFYQSRGKHIVTCVTEHKCVIESCRSLEREGFEVTYLPVKNDGLIDEIEYTKALRDDTILVSIMTANNEIGVIQDINKLSAIAKQKSPNVLFHTDAAQAIGKIDMKSINMQNIDLLSISGHKIYGPKGIGALYVRMKPRVRLVPLFDGGGQERGLRSGTLPVPLCVGLGEACRIAEMELREESARLLKMREWLLNKIQSELPKVFVNGSLTNRIPGNLNLSFAGVEGEGIMMGLGDIAVSSGSACTSATLEPSYVINALGVDVELSHSSIRISLGRFTTFEEIEIFAERLINTVRRLRSISPIWEE